MSLKKVLAKRILKKNVRELQGVVKKSYKVASKSMTRRLASIKLPIKVTISR